MLRKIFLSEFNNYLKEALETYADYDIVDICPTKAKSHNRKFVIKLSNGEDIHEIYIPYYVEDRETTVDILIE